MVCFCRYKKKNSYEVEFYLLYSYFKINKDSIFNTIKLHSIIKHKNGLCQVIIQMVSIQKYKYILMRLITFMVVIMVKILYNIIYFDIINI